MSRTKPPKFAYNTNSEPELMASEHNTPEEAAFEGLMRRANLEGDDYEKVIEVHTCLPITADMLVNGIAERIIEHAQENLYSSYQYVDEDFLMGTNSHEDEDLETQVKAVFSAWCARHGFDTADFYHSGGYVKYEVDETEQDGTPKSVKRYYDVPWSWEVEEAYQKLMADMSLRINEVEMLEKVMDRKVSEKRLKTQYFEPRNKWIESIYESDKLMTMVDIQHITNGLGKWEIGFLNKLGLVKLSNNNYVLTREAKKMLSEFYKKKGVKNDSGRDDRETARDKEGKS